mmetsp:Transcript_4755/g.6780  ORF Transcript_4755/g.6780 Transcript_4755/m.6780 type:complete len:211 (+) Transcript_4755:77-709(+)
MFAAATTISPCFEGGSILPNCGTQIGRFGISINGLNTMALCGSIPSHHTECNETMTIFERRFSGRPTFFKSRHVIGIDKELIGSHEALSGKNVHAVRIDISPAIDGFGYTVRIRDHILGEDAIVKCGTWGTLENEGGSDHGRNEGREGCTAMSFLERIALPPSRKIRLLIPYGERHVISRHIVIILTIIICGSFIVNDDSSHEMKVTESL